MNKIKKRNKTDTIKMAEVMLRNKPIPFWFRIFKSGKTADFRIKNSKDKKWHHIAVVSSRKWFKKTLAIYFDGEEALEIINW